VRSSRMDRLAELIKTVEIAFRRGGQANCAGDHNARDWADGFWLARFLERRGVEVQVRKSSSLSVGRRARRARTDVIDIETLFAR
jgi:hypothetical protein